MRRVFLVLLLAACAPSSKEGEAPKAQQVMSADEEERGVRLCQSYMERVCACADHDPSLRDTCDLAKGQPSAVRMHLEVLHGAPLARFGDDGKAIENAPAKKREPLGGPVGLSPTGGEAKRSPLNDGERKVTEGSLRKVIAACVQLDAQLDPARCPRL